LIYFSNSIQKVKLGYYIHSLGYTQTDIFQFLFPLIVMIKTDNS